MRTRIASIVLASTLGLGGVAAGLVLAPVAASAATDGTAAVGDRLERVKDALSGLVSDGSITQEQADEVATTLDEALPQGRGGPGGHDRGHGRGHGGPGGLRGLDAAATALGLTQDELRTALEGGSSLADVAAAEGVEQQALIDALVADAQEHLAEHAQREGLTDEQVAERTAQLTERITALVEREGLPLGRGHHGPDGGAGDEAEAPTPAPSATS